MKHFDGCHCEQCRKKRPPAADAPCGFLMQQILSSGKTQLRCESFCLSLCNLPCGLQFPLRITDVSVCSIPRAADASTLCDRGFVQVNVCIPLAVQLCDSCGNAHTAAAEITVPVQLRLPRHAPHDATQYAASALIRLNQTCGCIDDAARAQVYLDVCLQVFLVQLRPMFAPAPCAPSCFDLPLFPQPCRPEPPPCGCKRY